MAEDAFSVWLARGLAHQREGRPADAIPSLRRAARENARSPLPPFHLGEVLWQLGLRADAVAAWKAAADLDAGFVAPRLALAEAAMSEGDFAAAADAAAQAAAIDPANARAQATALAARAAAGEIDARSCREAIAPYVDSMPLVLVAALAAEGVDVPPAIASRAFTAADIESLRRLALSSRHEMAERFVAAYCALVATLPRSPVPLLWPERTGGDQLRLAFVVSPEPAGVESLRRIAKSLGESVAILVLCAGDAQVVRHALEADMPRGTVYMALPSAADIEVARLVAVRDCDVLVDAVGLAADTARMLMARPAREVWALVTGSPAHRPPIVESQFTDAAAVADALREVQRTRVEPRRDAAVADELARIFDEAVRCHRQGDLERAAEGYAQVLAKQPRFAPALQLCGVIAQARGEQERAATAFAAALEAEPHFVEARLSAAEAALAAREIDAARRIVQSGLDLAPYDIALLRMLARVEAAGPDAAAAEAAVRRLLAFVPADAQAHFDHGVALQRMGDAQGAARAYQRALTFRPDLIAADFNLGVLFEQQGNRRAAQAAYAHVIAVDPTRASAYKHLGELLLAAGEIDAWLANFSAFEKACPSAMPLAVYALEACQHLGDFARLDRYLDGLRRDDFAARDEHELADCLESLLYLLLFFDVEPSVMLRLAQAYDAVAPKVYGDRVALPSSRHPGPARIGYLSADLRNHVMGKMMWQAIANHDRQRFEIFCYSASAEHDEWTARFQSVAARFVEIAAMDDAAAVGEIAGDDLDLLVDLSTHTKGSRPGILARKPARVQLTHVASAGTVGLRQVDFKLTDRFADVAENQEFQLERLLAMEGCVYPFRHVAPATDHPFHRKALGISAEAVVIGAFVNPLKLSRRCLRLWRDVLERIPRARLAFSPANPATRASYLRIAAAAGIAAERVMFLPQGRDDAQNQARYTLVDIVLDTMPFGGVNGTLEALDMGVPVVTLVGKRHGERTTYSILANLGVTSTVAQTGREYVDIAVRLADDAAFRDSVRRAIAAGIAQSALTDMVAHTLHLEAAYVAAMESA